MALGLRFLDWVGGRSGEEGTGGSREPLEAAPTAAHGDQDEDEGDDDGSKNACEE